jgi:hypothetical protein
VSRGGGLTRDGSYSADVESYLLPIIMRIGRGDGPHVVAFLRRDLRRLYGEHAETVLAFMLLDVQSLKRRGAARGGGRCAGCMTWLIQRRR